MRVRIDRSNDRKAMALCDLGHAIRGRPENELVSLLDRGSPDTADTLEETLLRGGAWLLRGHTSTRHRKCHQKTHRRHTTHATPLHRANTRLKHTHPANWHTVGERIVDTHTRPDEPSAWNRPRLSQYKVCTRTKMRKMWRRAAKRLSG